MQYVLLRMNEHDTNTLDISQLHLIASYSAVQAAIYLAPHHCSIWLAGGGVNQVLYMFFYKLNAQVCDNAENEVVSRSTRSKKRPIAPRSQASKQFRYATPSNQNASGNATENATRNATRDANEQVTRNKTRNTNMNTIRNATRNVTPGATEYVTRNVTRNANRNATRNATPDATEAVNSNATKNTARNASNSFAPFYSLLLPLIPLHPVVLPLQATPPLVDPGPCEGSPLGPWSRFPLPLPPTLPPPPCVLIKNLK